MIWRDDDIGAGTNLEALLAVDDIFQRYRVKHTIAVMACGMETRGDLVEAILARGMDVQLHCWRHDDLSASHTAREELTLAMDTLTLLFHHRPTVLYPTWNRVSPELETAAAELRLTISARKVSLEQFIRCGGDCEEAVCNFHYWHPADALKVEPALRIYTSR